MGKALPRGPTLTWRTGPRAQRVAWQGGCPKLHLLKPLLPQHLSPWIKSPKGHERVRALGLSACLLQFFLEHLQISVSAPGRPAQSLLGRMPFPWPRATPWDPRISHCPVLRAALSSPGLWTEDHKGQQVSSGLATQHRT